MKLSRYMLYGRASIAGAFAAIALSFGSSGVALAAGTSCGPNGQLCSFQLQVDGATAGTGTYTIDPTTGDISLPGDGVTFRGTDWSFTVESLTGNADPVLIFATSATTGDVGRAFSMSFNLPINLNGPIIANSQIGYTLTSGTAAGARIQPIDEDGVLTAFDLDTSVGGQDPIDKQVGAGENFQFVGGPQTQASPVFSGGPSLLNLTPAYDTMSAIVAFGLSPNSAVGISGFVQQVPEPSTYALLFAGLAFVAFVARRRLH
jgi:hypothetical protein